MYHLAYMVQEAPHELLQALIRFETPNPPGNERACLQWLEGLLAEAGLETTMIGADPERPNLLARLAGAGAAPPLLLHGHVDVVPVDGQEWTRSPFGGELVDGWIWGRGALDMKSGVAMMVSAVLRLASSGSSPAGDVVLAILSDEEAGGALGAEYVVDHHPEHLRGVRFAVGEFGPASMMIAETRFYPIQVAEKQLCTLKGTVRGDGGHGAFPTGARATAKLGQLLTRLANGRLPRKVTPVVRRTVEEIAQTISVVSGDELASLLDGSKRDGRFSELDAHAAVFRPMFHNTVSVTGVSAGTGWNVVPAAADVTLDGRLLPDSEPADLMRQLRSIVGDEVTWELVRHQSNQLAPDWGFYAELAQIIRELDPDGVPVPILLGGATDGRHFAKLGIRHYGFLPLRLDDDFAFAQLLHAADERVPVRALEFGVEAVVQLLLRYGR